MSPLVARGMRWVDAQLPAYVYGADADTRRHARLMVAFTYALLAWGPVYALLYFALGMTYTAWTLVIACAATAATPVILRRASSLEPAGNWISAVLVVALALMCCFSGGVRSGAAVWLAAVGVFAIMLAGRTAGLVWSGISAVVVVALAVAGELGVAFINEVPQAYFGVYLTICLFGVTCLLASLAWLYESIKISMVGELHLAQSEIVTAHAQARRVLDNVEQGIVCVDRQGRVGGEYSTTINQWFGAVEPNTEIWRLLAQGGEEAARTALGLETFWETLSHGVLPLKLSLAQMPSRLQIESAKELRHLRIDYQPVSKGEAHGFEQMLVVLTDITADLEAERAQVAQREQLAAFARICNDRRSFEQFLHESTALVECVEAGAADSEVELRMLHTLKGNCGIFEVESIVELTHAIEESLERESRGLQRSEREALAECWRNFAVKVKQLLGNQHRGDIRVSQADYAALLAGLRGQTDRAQLVDLMGTWLLDPIEERLEHAARQARALAQRLEKMTPEIMIDAGGLRCDAKAWSGFWSAFVHVVRNAVDHGIETEDERVALGKNPMGRLEFVARMEGSQLVIEVSDDGRGISWDRVKERAIALGLPHDSRKDLELAIFADGLSTRREVSEVSGRGVGMAALRDAVAFLGGTPAIESRPGRGTSFRFVFAASALANLAPGEQMAA